MPVIKINNTNLSKLKLPPSGERVFYWDQDLKGFGVKAVSTGFVYVVQRRIAGRDSKLVKHVIGKHGEIDATEARTRAASALAELRQGADLNTVRKNELKTREVNELTLAQAYADFKSSKDLRPRTTQTYDENINRTLKEWLNLPLAAITPEMVLKKHKQISTAGVSGRGKGSANQAMRIVRVVFNYVMATKTDGEGQPLIQKNPVEVLNQLGAWNALQERETIVQADDLPAWYEAVMKQDSEKMQDFFLFLMFSGLGRSEAMRLEIDHFDTKKKVLTIPAQISKTKKTRQIPLTDVLIGVYERRKQAHVVSGKPDYVFQGRHGKGHLTEPKRGVYEVREKSGINWSSHDLRRSYVTLANKLDVSAYKVKFLVGHSVSGDVTGKHYSKLTVDDVRDAAQDIANYLKEKMGMADVALAAVHE